MLPNGIVVTLDLALETGEAWGEDEPLLYSMLLLGLFREDIALLPLPFGQSLSFPSLSLGHLWPLSKWRFSYLYKKSIRLARKKRWAKSYYFLGRSLHVLVDMACPVHAHPVCHYLRDPYERYVEHHAQALKQLPVPNVMNDAASVSMTSYITRLATQARQEQADRTQSPWGKLAKKAGFCRPLNYAVIAPQAHRLIPLAAGYVRRLLDEYRIQSGLSSIPANSACDSEKLSAPTHTV